MRIQLRGLFERRPSTDGGAAQTLRARWEGSRPPVQKPAPEARSRAAAKSVRTGFDGCSCYGCSLRREAFKPGRYVQAHD